MATIQDKLNSVLGTTADGDVVVNLGGQDSSGNPEAIVLQDGAIPTINQEADVATLQDYDLVNMVAGDTVVETWDVSIFDEMTVTISRDSGTTDTILINTSADGVTLSPVPASGRDASDGAFISLTGLTSGQYTIPLNAKTVTFTKSGTTDPYTITWSARNAGRQAY